jgi:hypothetical protein
MNRMMANPPPRKKIGTGRTFPFSLKFETVEVVCVLPDSTCIELMMWTTPSSPTNTFINLDVYDYLN